MTSGRLYVSVCHLNDKTINFATDMLEELARREKSAGIKPDEDLDIFMKVDICLNHLLSNSASL